MNIGFIGLGRMGGPMARRILKGGHRLLVHDLRREACSALVADGARACATPAEVAGHAEMVLTSLPGPKEVEAVMTGPDGVFRSVIQGAFIIDTSTVGPSLSQKLEQKFRAKGAAYLDAPVSGGREGAVAGTLAVMVGGDPAAFERARPILTLIASRPYYLGPSGSGNAVKLVNQMIYLAYVAAVAEGLALGEHLGIPFDKLFEVLVNSSAGKPGIEKRYEMLEANDLSPRFEVSSALKDLTLARELYGARRKAAPVAEAAIEAYQHAAQLGLGDKDLTALRQLYRDLLEQAKNRAF